jgi:hypothetical protein
MRQLTAALLATTVLLPTIASAQIKTIPGDSITLTATVEAIERSTRSVTLKGPQGNLVTITAPPEMKRFAELKVGDTVTARYYENVVLRLKKPGEKAVDSSSDAVTPGTGQKPGATAASQRTITATITAIDPKVPSLTLSGPNNWSYSGRIEDKNVLNQIKVGDRLDVTWTEAVMVSIDAPK